jgi:hypothetical protein
MRHPYDLIGLRRFKLFEDSLKNYLNNEGKVEPNVTCRENLMEKMSQCFKLNGQKQRIFKVFKIIAVVALVTLVVNVNDYYQDIKNTNEFQAILLLKFYPPAMFLTVVTIFSTFQIIFHLPSLWYRIKVSMQMESPVCELGQEIIQAVVELLKLSTLFPSLLSSVCSLTYGQFVTHSITYRYQTS